jgi:hypothetical protein
MIAAHQTSQASALLPYFGPDRAGQNVQKLDLTWLAHQMGLGDVPDVRAFGFSLLIKDMPAAVAMQQNLATFLSHGPGPWNVDTRPDGGDGTPWLSLTPAAVPMVSSGGHALAIGVGVGVAGIALGGLIGYLVGHRKR